MVLLAAVVMPHGAMPFDGDEQSPSSAVRERYSRLDPVFRDSLSQLFSKTCEVVKAIAALQADLYIIHTPHGISLSDAYAVYGNRHAAGDAHWLGQWSEFQVSVNLDHVRTKQWKDLLVASGIDTQIISCYGGYEDVVLRWAEAIPIWYLQKYITNEPKYLVMAQDIKPRTGCVEDWRLNVGRKLASFVESLQEKVVVVISGDLSHCHPTNCTDPLYLPNSRYEPLPSDKDAAEAFDEAVTAWTQAQNERGWDSAAALHHLDAAVKLEPSALSCIWKGLLVLHGLLSEYSHSGVHFRPQIAVRKAPTYFGMMAATFVRN